ncbi:DUF3368 domain-containing protein (plasmid) [Helicobacter sp. NHP19-012]|uniref:DUF3368 domain-containing protein n=1 Tax=Helicobacter gastrofelis TaxID=2849642 RepID=A0ABN6I8X0_9HELI|nr:MULTISPECIES: DUF3368 domain-containing protein [unclassified Helicobacter]BCZ20025.1 DUF3368 domain-containing protein [Helicobacter sp. NHP19-012]GMB96924.1 DUF3368 domain-containing protein [Helicobacter sp. NHP22-001]
MFEKNTKNKASLVVSDTTPLISFLKMGTLDLLGDFFGYVYIPSGVFAELTENERFQDEAKQIRDCKFIQVCSVPKEETAKLKKNTGLDLGECEAIVLAKTLKAELLLMDERKGRAEAQKLSLKITGTLGILLQMKEEGFVSSTQLQTFVEALERHKLFISQKLLNMLFEG